MKALTGSGGDLHKEFWQVKTSWPPLLPLYFDEEEDELDMKALPGSGGDLPPEF
jgi:hypothetical protein